MRRDLHISFQGSIKKFLLKLFEVPFIVCLVCGNEPYATYLTRFNVHYALKLYLRQKRISKVLFIQKVSKM